VVVRNGTLVGQRGWIEPHRTSFAIRNQAATTRPVLPGSNDRFGLRNRAYRRCRA
jgi:hypothetical protein